jgi:hypothetical protein
MKTLALVLLLAACVDIGAKVEVEGTVDVTGHVACGDAGIEIQ